MIDGLFVSEAGEDEIELGGIAIDETADVGKVKPFKVGSFNAGDQTRLLVLLEYIKEIVEVIGPGLQTGNWLWNGGRSLEREVHGDDRSVRQPSSLQRGPAENLIGYLATAVSGSA